MLVASRLGHVRNVKKADQKYEMEIQILREVMEKIEVGAHARKQKKELQGIVEEEKKTMPTRNQKVVKWQDCARSAY